jgi:hypothetical protein
MRYGKTWGANEEVLNRSYDVSSETYGRVRQHVTTRTYWVVLIMFVSLQIADVVTTNRTLAIPSNWEANAIMHFSQSQLGASWWTPKIAIVGFAAIVLRRLGRRWPMVFVLSYYVIVVTGNLLCF